MQKHEEKTGKNLIFLILLLVPVIVAAVFLFHAKKNHDLKKKMEYERQVQLQAEAEKKELAEKEAENQKREYWKKTIQDVNALIAEENFAAAIAKMEKIREEIKEPAFIKKTDTYIQNTVKLRELAVKKLMNKLTNEANSYINEGNLRKALAVYKDYSGKLAEETKEEREKMAEKISDHQNRQARNN